MLRPTATRITLDASDIDWHNKRRKDRLARLAKHGSGKQSAAPVNDPDVEAQSPGPKRKAVPDKLPIRSSHDNEKDQDIPTYSDEPVPQDSPEFWDKVIRDAGPSARIHHAPLARTPQVFVPSATFLENNGSVHLSVRGQEEDGHRHTPEQNPGEVLASPNSPIRSSLDGGASTQVLNRLSPRSLPVLDSEEDNDQGGTRLNSPILLDNPSPQRFEDDSQQHVETDSRPKSMGRDRDNDTPWVNQMDVDGPSDAGTSSSPPSSNSSFHGRDHGTSKMSRGSHQPSRIDILAQRIASMALSRAGTSMDWIDDEIRKFYSPEEIRLPNLAQQHRARSGGLPLSRLRIAETAASSSPEKDLEPHNRAGSSGDDDSPRPRSILPRRRRDYRRRSQTYSYTPSEASASYESRPPIAGPIRNPLNPDSDDEFSFANLEYGGSSFTIPTRDTTDSPHEPIRTRMDDNQLSSSSGNSRRHHSGQLYDRVPSRVPSTSTNANTPPSHASPLPNAFLASRERHREQLESMGLGSSNRRRPIARVPPLSPGELPARNNYNLQQHNLRSNENDRAELSNLNRPSTPPDRRRGDAQTTTHATPTRLPTTPSRMTVYNDSLPPSTQPQTPHGLPRRGLPRTGPGAYFSAYATAPVPHNPWANAMNAGIEGRDLNDNTMHTMDLVERVRERNMNGLLSRAMATPSRTERERALRRVRVGLGMGVGRVEQENLDSNVRERGEGTTEEDEGMQEEGGESEWEDV